MSDTSNEFRICPWKTGYDPLALFSGNPEWRRRYRLSRCRKPIGSKHHRSYKPISSPCISVWVNSNSKSSNSKSACNAPPRPLTNHPRRMHHDEAIVSDGSCAAKQLCPNDADRLVRCLRRESGFRGGRSSGVGRLRKGRVRVVVGGRAPCFEGARGDVVAFVPVCCRRLVLSESSRAFPYLMELSRDQLAKHSNFVVSDASQSAPKVL